jgi:hypothetical protein
MPRKNPDVGEADEKDLEVGKPKEWAAGIPGVLHSMRPAIKHMGLGRTEKTLLAKTWWPPSRTRTLPRRPWRTQTSPFRSPRS